MKRLLLPPLVLFAAAACTGQSGAAIRALTAHDGAWTATTWDYRDWLQGDQAGTETLIDAQDYGGQVEWTFTQDRNAHSAAYFSDWRTGELTGPDGWSVSFDWDVDDNAARTDVFVWFYLYEDTILRMGEWHATFGQVDADRIDLSIRHSRGSHRYESDVVLDPR